MNDIEINNDVEDILSKLTLEQKIGQMICIGLNTTYVDDEFNELLSNYPFGSVGLFNRNIENPQQLISLTQEIQKIVTPACSGLKAMIALDQEGGVVSQFSSGITHIPGNLAIAAVNSEESSFNCSQITGLELSEIGITMNWAPVVDLNSNPLNEIVDVRSFGDNAKLVSSFGTTAIKGLHAGGVGATAKHFPGHGNIAPCFETNLPTNINSINHLYENDLMPFNHASKANVDAIMVAPIAVPAFENNKTVPATLSHNLITNVLRNEFNFKGVVMIDDLDHEAIINKYTLKKAAQKTIVAGADMIILCHSKHHQAIIFNSLLNAAKKGIIKPERIDESVRRIIRMKLNLEEYYKNRVNLSAITKNKIVDQLCKKSIVLFSDSKSLIPIDKFKYKSALVVLPKLVSLALADSSETLHCSLGEQLMSDFDKIRVVNVPLSISDEQSEAIINAAVNYDLVIVASENSNDFPSYLNLINALEKIKPLIIVSLRHPYEVGFFPAEATVLMAFSYIDSSMEAVRNVLVGKHPATGILPVDLDSFVTQ